MRVAAASPFDDPRALVPLASGPHGLSRSEVVRNQVSRLLAATFQLVAEHGYAATTVKAITDLAGISRRTFYELFADREDCFLAAYDEADRRLRAAVAAATRGAATREERVAGVITTVLAAVVRHPVPARACMVEGVAGCEGVRGRRERTLEALEQLLADDGVRAVRARLALGGLWEVIGARLADGAVAELPALGPELVAVTVDVLRPAGLAR